MTRIRKLWYSVLATLGAAGVWFAAMTSTQPATPEPPIPLMQVGITEWVLTNEYQTAFTLSGHTYRVTIKAGFRSDLASLGRADKPLGVSRDAPCIRRGALVHDALYATRYLTREQSDMVLYLICLQDGMDRAKAQAVYQAVQTWGWLVWENKSAESLANAREKVYIRRVQ